MVGKGWVNRRFIPTADGGTGSRFVLVSTGCTIYARMPHIFMSSLFLEGYKCRRAGHPRLCHRQRLTDAEKNNI